MKNQKDFLEETKTSKSISQNGRITSERECSKYMKSNLKKLVSDVFWKGKHRSQNFRIEEAEEIVMDSIMVKMENDIKDLQKGLLDKEPYKIRVIWENKLKDHFREKTRYKNGATKVEEVVVSNDGEATVVEIKRFSSVMSFSTPIGEDDGMTLEGMIPDKSKPFFKNEEDAIGFYENLKTCLVMFFRQKLGFGAEMSHVYSMADIFIVMMQRQIDDDDIQDWRQDHYPKSSDNTFGESKKEDDRISALAIKYNLTESYIKNNFTHVKAGYEKTSNKFPFANKEIYHEFISWCKNWQNRKKSDVQGLILYALEK